MEPSKPDPSVSVTSPVKTTITPPHDTDVKSSVGTFFRMKSEKPTEPPNAEPAFAQADTTDVSVGNPRYTAELMDEGRLGLFLPRPAALRTPIPVTLNVDHHWTGIYHTLESAIRRLIRSKTEMADNEIAERSQSLAAILADGCCLITYMKLRALLFIEFPSRYNSISLKRPKAFKDLPIPTPFAFAIQQLGAVNAADLATEHRFVPVFPTTGHRFGIPRNREWNSNAYAEAVEYARSLGLQFALVDLNKKSGTAWWLLKQYFSEDCFELQCLIPETNFTIAMALTHSLYLEGDVPNPINEIFDLTPLGTSVYGHIMRDPHCGINVSTFEAIEAKASEVVSLV